MAFVKRKGRARKTCRKRRVWVSVRARDLTNQTPSSGVRVGARTNRIGEGGGINRPEPDRKDSDRADRQTDIRRDRAGSRRDIIDRTDRRDRMHPAHRDRQQQPDSSPTGTVGQQP